MSRLKQELLSLDSTISDFTRRNPGDIPDTPSWKFPERTASQVDVKQCLQDKQEGDNTVLLELVYDRCVRIMIS